MTYAVYRPKRDRPPTRGDKAQFQIVEVPEGSSPDDVTPENGSFLDVGYRTKEEARRAIDEEKDRSRPDTI